jgi:hypothetical protein
MVIDPSTRQVQMADRLWLTPASGGRYYTSTQDFSGRWMITDVRPRADPGGPEEWYDFFVCDTALLLVYREKHQLLWDGAGQGGPILANTTYYYAPLYGHAAADFQTVGSNLYPLAERPSVSSTAAVPPDRLTLDNVSVVRALAGPGSIVVASANYSPTGALMGLHYGGSDSTTTARAPNGASFSIGTNFLDDSVFRAVFGLLPKFPVADYVAGRAQPWTPMGAPAVFQLVNFHYARNSVVRQDVYDSTGHASTRWLTFVVTHEDSVLAPIDSTRVFGYSYHAAPPGN